MCGCVGVASVTEGIKFQYSNPEILPKMGEIQTQSRSVLTYSDDQLVELWGKPDTIEYIHSQGGKATEQWIYSREIGWSGVIAFVVIPIPLVVPVGYRDTILTIENGRVVHGKYMSGTFQNEYIFPSYKINLP